MSCFYITIIPSSGSHEGDILPRAWFIVNYEAEARTLKNFPRVLSI